MFVTPVEDMAWFPEWGKSSGGGTNEIMYVTNRQREGGQQVAVLGAVPFGLSV